MSEMEYRKTVKSTTGTNLSNVSFNTGNIVGYNKIVTSSVSGTRGASTATSIDLTAILTDNIDETVTSERIADSRKYNTDSITTEQLATPTFQPEVLIFEEPTTSSNQSESTEPQQPTIDSGSTYNPFGTDSTILGYELPEEDIKNKISDNNELITLLDEQIKYYEDMQDDVYIDAVGWYNDFYFNWSGDFFGTLFRCLCGPPSNDMCLSMFKCASDEEFFEVSGYTKEEYNASESNILMMEQYRKSLANENASLKYLQITEEKSYETFTYTPKGYDSIKGSYGDYISKEIYNNMTDEEKKMLQYLESTYGKDKAIEYLKDMEDIWNQRAGYLRAQDRINSLDTTDEGKLKEEIGNILGVSWDGVGDGWNSFWEGIVLAFTADGKMSAEQYERMFYLSYLQQYTQGLDFWYNAGSAVGTMAPIVGLTTISAVVCPYLSEGVAAAVSTATPYVAGSIMAVSSFGNTMDQTLYSGYSRDVAFIYSLCVAGSDALLEVLLGGINGLGVSPKIGKNFLVQFLGQVGKEGLQEGLQTIIEMGIFDSLILGKEINLDEIGPATLESVLIGMIVAGSMNVASGATVITANLTINGVTYALDSVQLKAALDLSKQNNIPLIEAIKQIGTNQKIQDYIKSEDFKGLESYLNSLNTEESTKLLKELITTMDTKDFQKLLSSDISEDMLKNISNIISLTYSQNGSFNIDFGAVYTDLASKNPSIASFFSQVESRNIGYYESQIKKANPSLTDAEVSQQAKLQLQTWSVLQYMQAVKLSNNPDVDFLNVVNNSMNKQGLPTYGNSIDAYFSVLEMCIEARAEIAELNQKYNDYIKDPDQYIKDHPGEQIPTKQDATNAYNKYKWLDDLTIQIAQNNGHLPTDVDAVSFFQYSDEYIKKWGSVGRPNMNSQIQNGGACCCDVAAVDTWIIDKIGELVDKGITDPKAFEEAFIVAYMDYAQITDSRYKEHFYRAVATDINGYLSNTSGLNCNAFDLEWALGGETLAMNEEFILEAGVIPDPSTLGPTTESIAQINGKDAYSIRYATGLDGIIQEMINSDRISDATKAQLEEWYQMLYGKTTS